LLSHKQVAIETIIIY